MGYQTDFDGEFTCTPALTLAQVAYLNRFSNSRRMKRNATIVATFPDPLREAVGLPVGVEGEFYVDSEENAETIVNYNEPPSTQPGLWCQWVPNNEGHEIVWDGNEKFYDYVAWLEYIIDNFLSPWGIKLNGKVSWQGEENDDRGTIYVKDNKVEALKDKVVQQKPSWMRKATNAVIPIADCSADK